MNLGATIQPTTGFQVGDGCDGIYVSKIGLRLQCPKWIRVRKKGERVRSPGEVMEGKAWWGRWRKGDRFGICLGGGVDTISHGLDVSDKEERSRMLPIVWTPGWPATRPHTL